jgi:hypothetical protein
MIIGFLKIFRKIRVYDDAGTVIETHGRRASSKSRERYSETKSRHAVKRDG